MRYPCLVVDHDDTVVDSTATVHYPCFVEYTGIYHPEVHYTLDEYIKDNFDPGIVALFRDIIGMSEEEIARAGAERIPSGKFQTGEDIANACVFLLSDASKQVTGTDIACTGGFRTVGSVG